MPEESRPTPITLDILHAQCKRLEDAFHVPVYADRRLGISYQEFSRYHGVEYVAYCGDWFFIATGLPHSQTYTSVEQITEAVEAAKP